MPSKTDPIIIIGAGVFGLSTSIHLAKRGYNNITVFDKHAYDQSGYSYFKGADAASADINKIIRSAYGGVSIYQDLSLEAIEHWRAWNAELEEGIDLPPGMRKGERVLVPNGNLIMTDREELSEFDRASVESMEAAGHHHSQLVMSDPEHRAIAEAKGFAFAIDPFRRGAKNKSKPAILDTTGGTAIADKACRFAMHKAKRMGVRFVLHPVKGALRQLVYDETTNRRKVMGIETQDGTQHIAAMTILACGGWTPSVLPELDYLCEATAGSVAFIKIPKQSPLWDRFSENNFPSWQWNMRDGAEGGLYGFARDKNGWVKIGYRGTKYTNPVRCEDGKERSVPVTRWSSATDQGDLLTSIPQQAMKVIQGFMDEYLPELKKDGLGISMTRVCWYNDSYDNHLLIDRVPDHDGLMVATAGSGHAFKYLPIIGKYVVDIMEGVDLERASLKAWRWRKAESEEQVANVLMEGSTGARALTNVSLAIGEETRARL